MKLIHGGDVEGFREEFGREPLDFSANISPLGLPEGVRQGVIDSLSQATQYPDPLCRKLRRAIGEKEGIDPEYIQCGNGAADLIFRLVLAKRPRRALVTTPTFAEYEQALTAFGCEVEWYLLTKEEGFALTPRFLEALEGKPDMVFLCNPNNPTGNLIAPSLLWQIWEKCWEKGILLVVDECFLSFLPRPWEHTLKKEVQEGAPLLLLRAFTKLYAMAGIRLGYCLCGDRQLLARMAGVGQPWGVSVLAQQAGLAALREDRYVENVRALIGKERPWLWQQLERAGVHVVGGSVNYLFFRSDVPQLGEKMRHLGVMIRSCANYPGLSEGWYRVAVRTREENQRLAECIRQAGEGDR